MPLGKKANADNFDAVVAGVTESITDFVRSPTRRKRKKKAKVTKRKYRSYHKSSKRKRSGHKSKHSVRRKPAGNTQRSKKRVGSTYYTKKGQPYKILKSGRARFIKGKRMKRR